MDEKPPTTTQANLSKFNQASRAEAQHYSAIGRVAAAWSYFEATIDTASIALAQIGGEKGVCFTAQIAGSARKLDAYIARARLSGISKKLISDLCQFADGTHSLNERRNSPQRLEATAKKIVKLQLVPTSTQELMTLADDISQHVDQFDKLVDRVADELKTLLEKGHKETDH
jgi:hypothetical protein